MQTEGRLTDSFVVSSMSHAPKIIGRGTAHAAMIFTELLRKEQYELQRAASARNSSSPSASTRSPRTPTVAWSARMPIQDSDSDGSDASLPSDSCTVSSEVQRAARSELARQMKHSKELQTALEASQKEMDQLQGRISKLETIAHAAPQDIGSSSVVAWWDAGDGNSRRDSGGCGRSSSQRGIRSRPGLPAQRRPACSAAGSAGGRGR